MPAGAKRREIWGISLRAKRENYTEKEFLVTMCDKHQRLCSWYLILIIRVSWSWGDAQFALRPYDFQLTTELRIRSQNLWFSIDLKRTKDSISDLVIFNWPQQARIHSLNSDLQLTSELKIRSQNLWFSVDHKGDDKDSISDFVIFNWPR